MLIGLLINPFAGIGGKLGLKGSDELSTLGRMFDDAGQVAIERARLALSTVKGLDEHRWLTASGPMGADLLTEMGVVHEVVHRSASPSTREDTVQTVREFVAKDVDLIVFCGGDGTAADLLRADPFDILCLGIPAGVKMHSAVFANTSIQAGSLLQMVLNGGMATKRGEVMDIDEAAFQAGELKAKLIGYLAVPDESSLVQPPKGAISSPSDAEEKEELGEQFKEMVRPGVLYIIGAGTTCEALMAPFGQRKTLLGVDIFLDGDVIAYDVDEKGILREMENCPGAQIVVSPIGEQGFIFGRGNQQISDKVIERVGAKNILVLATPSKMRTIRTLHVDTGNEDLDRKLRGHMRVVIGYHRERVVRVE